ncbi:MAG: alkaline phosphatase [Parvularculaceae bacterium]
MSRPAAALVFFLAAAGAAGAQEGPTLPQSDSYYAAGQETLARRKAVKPNKRRAKNVILFVADGMDPTTVAAARIFDGQTRGEDGEENLLSFERFPYIAMSKTYTTNAQTPDSAGTMSAMVTGIKTKSGVLSVSDAAAKGDCASGLGAIVPTLGELSEMAGLATGIVSTARITHATPGAVYAHSAERGWESDADLPAEAAETGCRDIARQFIEFPYGDGLEVAMGGGRSNFLPAEAADPERPDATGRRLDGRNLALEWTAKSNAHVYVWNQQGFDAVDPAADPRLLGLFNGTHMQYELQRHRDPGGEPSLAEMTKKAIEILSRDKDGYFLMVEGGRVDHAHHAGNAAHALKDVQAYSEAVATARAMTREKDTLIIVTADHGHTLAFQGYPAKGSDILGLATTVAGGKDSLATAYDGKPYTTLVYANGPGSVFIDDNEDGRPTPSAEEVADPTYRQQALIPAESESHGGQDVTIYASGPRAYLFGGVVEQNYIFHVIDDALKLSKRAGVQ